MKRAASGRPFSCAPGMARSKPPSLLPVSCLSSWATGFKELTVRNLWFYDRPAMFVGRYCEFAGLVSTVSTKIIDKDGVLPKIIL
jgi:hypothetical protein